MPKSVVSPNIKLDFEGDEAKDTSVFSLEKGNYKIDFETRVDEGPFGYGNSFSSLRFRTEDGGDVDNESIPDSLSLITIQTEGVAKGFDSVLVMDLEEGNYYFHINTGVSWKVKLSSATSGDIAQVEAKRKAQESSRDALLGDFKKLKESRDYDTLMELVESGDESQRVPALLTIAMLSEDETSKEAIKKTIDFLSKLVQHNSFVDIPSEFGEVQSFLASQFEEGGSLGLAPALMLVIPSKNNNFEDMIKDSLYSIAEEAEVEVQLNCATALLRLKDNRCFEFFEQHLNAEDYRYRSHCILGLGFMWEGMFPDDSATREKRIQLIIGAMTPVVFNGIASMGWQTEVQSAGAKSLGNMKNRNVFPVLMALAEKYENDWLEDDIILAMGNLKDPRAEPYLQKLIDGAGEDGDPINPANMVKTMRGIDSNANAEVAKEMITQLEGESPSAENSYYIDYSVLDGATIIESGGPFQDLFPDLGDLLPSPPISGAMEDDNEVGGFVVSGVPSCNKCNDAADVTGPDDDGDYYCSHCEHYIDSMGNCKTSSCPTCDSGDDDDDDDTYYANDCDCGATAKISGDLLQEYIDDDMMYECDECEKDIDPEIGWYSISLDDYIED